MMSLQKIEKIVMYKSNLSYPFGYHNANKAQKIHQILKINSIINTVYQVFSACIHFPLCSREYQSHEKCIRINLTQSLANQVD